MIASGDGVPKQDLRWGVRRRLEFIEQRLFWEGRVNRHDLSEAFGISSQQASADFARYLEIAPANATYDRSAKGYVRGPAFSPTLAEPDASRYLAHLRLVGDGVVESPMPGLSFMPEFDVVPGPARRIDARVLQAVVEAIRDGREIEVSYQSMSRPEPERRWIGPHALAWDGFRWHVRSWCPKTVGFRDFVLARMSAPSGTRRGSGDPGTDKGWHNRVRVIIGPHPGLSEGQRKAVEADYSMTGGVSVIDVRTCFLWYFLRRFGLDGDAASRRPQDQHVVLLNRDDVLATFAERQDV